MNITAKYYLYRTLNMARLLIDSFYIGVILQIIRCITDWVCARLLGEFAEHTSFLLLTILPAVRGNIQYLLLEVLHFVQLHTFASTILTNCFRLLVHAYITCVKIVSCRNLKFCANWSRQV